MCCFFFFQAEDGIRDYKVTGVQTCALPISDTPCTIAGHEAEDTLEQDAQLVQQCLQGDGSAWEALARRHSRRIFNICYRFTGNGTEAEDLSQDVFLRVYRTLASYRSAHGGFATWVTM